MRASSAATPRLRGTVSGLALSLAALALAGCGSTASTTSTTAAIGTAAKRAAAQAKAADNLAPKGRLADPAGVLP